MDTTNRKRALAMVAGSFMAFFAFGLVDVLKGSTLSAVLEEMRFTYSQGGVIVMAAYFGFVVGTFATGFISDLIGRKSVIIIAGLCYLAGLAGYASSESFSFFAFSFFAIGFGCGSIELGSNHIIIDVKSGNSGRYINLLGSFYGLGSMLAPIYAGIMFRLGLGWRDIYYYGLIIPVILLAYFLLARYPRVENSRPATIDFRELARTAFTRHMWLLYIVSFAYVATEVSIASWLVEYLKVIGGIPIERGTTWLALYFAGIMLGRFAGSFVVERIGYVRIMTLAVVLVGLCTLGGAFGRESLAFLLPLSGLFLSVVLTTATACVAYLVKINMGTILGLFFVFGGAGGMAGPWIQGIANDYFGLRIGMLTPAFFCLIMLACLILLRTARIDERRRQS